MADRHNCILMSLLLLVAEAMCIKMLHMFQRLKSVNEMQAVFSLEFQGMHAGYIFDINLFFYFHAVFLGANSRQRFLFGGLRFGFGGCCSGSRGILGWLWFCVGWRTAAGFTFYFSGIFLVLAGPSFWWGGWALGYHSMGFRQFPDIC